MIGQVWVNKPGGAQVMFVVVREARDSDTIYDVWDCLVLVHETRPDVEGVVQPCSGTGIKEMYQRLV